MSDEYEVHIYIGDLLSFRTFQAFAERRGWDEWFRPYIEPQWLCWFIEIMKQSDDDPALFPHGKWATIQVLENKVAAMAAGLRHNTSQPRA